MRVHLICRRDDEELGISIAEHMRGTPSDLWKDELTWMRQQLPASVEYYLVSKERENRKIAHHVEEKRTLREEVVGVKVDKKELVWVINASVPEVVVGKTDPIGGGVPTKMVQERGGSEG